MGDPCIIVGNTLSQRQQFLKSRLFGSKNSPSIPPMKVKSAREGVQAGIQSEYIKTPSTYQAKEEGSKENSNMNQFLNELQREYVKEKGGVPHGLLYQQSRVMEQQMGMIAENQRQMGSFLKGMGRGNIGEAAQIKDEVFNSNRRMLLDVLGPLNKQVSDVNNIYEKTKNCAEQVKDKVDELCNVITKKEQKNAVEDMVSSKYEELKRGRQSMGGSILPMDAYQEGVSNLTEQIERMRGETERVEVEMHNRYIRMLEEAQKYKHLNSVAQSEELGVGMGGLPVSTRGAEIKELLGEFDYEGLMEDVVWMHKQRVAIQRQWTDGRPCYPGGLGATHIKAFFDYSLPGHKILMRKEVEIKEGGRGKGKITPTPTPKPTTSTPAPVIAPYSSILNIDTLGTPERSRKGKVKGKGGRQRERSTPQVKKTPTPSRHKQREKKPPKLGIQALAETKPEKYPKELGLKEETKKNIKGSLVEKRDDVLRELNILEEESNVNDIDIKPKNIGDTVDMSVKEEEIYGRGKSQSLLPDNERLERLHQGHPSTEINQRRYIPVSQASSQLVEKECVDIIADMLLEELEGSEEREWGGERKVIESRGGDQRNSPTFNARGGAGAGYEVRGGVGNVLGRELSESEREYGEEVIFDKIRGIIDEVSENVSVVDKREMGIQGGEEGGNLGPRGGAGGPRGAGGPESIIEGKSTVESPKDRDPEVERSASNVIVLERKGGGLEVQNIPSMQIGHGHTETVNKGDIITSQKADVLPTTHTTHLHSKPSIQERVNVEEIKLKREQDIIDRKIPINIQGFMGQGGLTYTNYSSYSNPFMLTGLEKVAQPHLVKLADLEISSSSSDSIPNYYHPFDTPQHIPQGTLPHNINVQGEPTFTRGDISEGELIPNASFRTSRDRDHHTLTYSPKESENRSDLDEEEKDHYYSLSPGENFNPFAIGANSHTQSIYIYIYI